MVRRTIPAIVLVPLMSMLVVVAAEAGEPPATGTFEVEGIYTGAYSPQFLPGAPSENYLLIDSTNCAFSKIAYFSSDAPLTYTFTAPVEAGGETCLYDLTARNDLACWPYLTGGAELANGTLAIPGGLTTPVTVDFTESAGNTIPVTLEYDDVCGEFIATLDPPLLPPPELVYFNQYWTMNRVEVDLGGLSSYDNLIPIGTVIDALYVPGNDCSVLSENPLTGIVMERRTEVVFEIECGETSTTTTTTTTTTVPHADPPTPIPAPPAFTG